MERVIPYRGDWVAEVWGPVDNTTVDKTTGLGDALDEIPDATMTARIYNRMKTTKVVELVTKLSADAAGSATSMSVDSIVGYFSGDTVEVEQDDGTVKQDTINGAPAAGVIELTAGLDSAASKHSKLRRVTMGTACTHIAVASVGEQGRRDPNIDWMIDDVVEIMRDDFTLQTPNVAQVLFDPCPIIVLADVLSAEVSPGRSLKNKLGSDLTGSSYGTFPGAGAATPGDKAWGYRATVDKNHDVEIRPGMRVRAEMIVADGTIDAYFISDATVKEITELL